MKYLYALEADLDLFQDEGRNCTWSENHHAENRHAVTLTSAIHTLSASTCLSVITAACVSDRKIEEIPKAACLHVCTAIVCVCSSRVVLSVIHLLNVSFTWKAVSEFYSIVLIELQASQFDTKLRLLFVLSFTFSFCVLVSFPISPKIMLKGLVLLRCVNRC